MVRWFRMGSGLRHPKYWVKVGGKVPARPVGSGVGSWQLAVGSWSCWREGLELKLAAVSRVARYVIHAKHQSGTWQTAPGPDPRITDIALHYTASRILGEFDLCVIHHIRS